MTDTSEACKESSCRVARDGMLQPQTDTKEPTAQQGNGRGPGGAAGLPPPPTAMEQPPQPALVEPEVLPRPRMNPCSKRTLEVVSQGRIHAVDCLVSLASDAVYGLIRTLRPAIYGKVKLGMTLEQRGADGSYHMVTDKPVAVKIIRKDKLGGRSQEDPLKEIAVMQHLSDPGHPNVMGLVEVLEDPECIYLVLPFCDGGEICQWFERSRYMLREEVARGFFLQILSGLQYLHARGVVHRDMSLENLLYDQKTRRCIIIDLGMCIKLPVPATSEVLVKRQGYCGKLTYMSNEIYKNRDFYAAAVDIWALGVILFIMLTGIPPVETPAEIDPRFRMLQEGRLFELMDLWKVTFLSAEARDLLKGMLQVDPRARLSTEQIKAHPWLAGPIAAALLEGGGGGGGGEEGGQDGQGQGGDGGAAAAAAGAAAADGDAMSI